MSFFDVGNAQRAFGLHVIAEHAPRTLGHIAEEFVFDGITGTLHGNHQQVGLDIAHEHLNTAVVHAHQVVEGEHIVLNFLHQVGVNLSQAAHNRGFQSGLGEVHDLGRSLDTTKTRGLCRRIVGELFLHDGFQLFHR